MADDILRLLAYEPYIPRSVLVDYLKTLMAFHLALYHLKLLQMLPKLVKQRSGNDLCSTKECPINPALDNALEGCPYRVALVVDMGDAANPHMAELARKSTDRLYRQIPAFVQANFVVKKLDEMAEYLSKKTGKLASPANGVFSVGDLVSLLKTEHDGERQAYFKFRLASLIEESSSGNEDVDPEIREVTTMGLGEFESLHRDLDGLSRQISPPVHHGMPGLPVAEKQRKRPSGPGTDQGQSTPVRAGQQVTRGSPPDSSLDPGWRVALLPGKFVSRSCWLS
jgi:hypothetical protein